MLPSAQQERMEDAKHRQRKLVPKMNLPGDDSAEKRKREVLGEMDDEERPTRRADGRALTDADIRAAIALSLDFPREARDGLHQHPGNMEAPSIRTSLDMYRSLLPRRVERCFAVLLRLDCRTFSQVRHLRCLMQEPLLSNGRKRAELLAGPKAPSGSGHLRGSAKVM